MNTTMVSFQKNFVAKVVIITTDINANNELYFPDSDNKLLVQLSHIETQLEKLYSQYDPRADNDETKFLTVISDLADRELVITISWAKQVPGIASLDITKTCPYNKQRIFSALKIENFIGKKMIFSIFMFKTLIVCTC